MLIPKQAISYGPRPSLRAGLNVDLRRSALCLPCLMPSTCLGSLRHAT